MSSWTLSQEIDLLIDEVNKEICIYQTRSKADQAAASKCIKYIACREIKGAKDYQFSLRLGEGLTPYVKCDKIDSGTWYKLNNYMTPENRNYGIWSILESIPCEAGDFKGELFEPCFSDSDRGQVYLVSKNMPIRYKSCLEEMKRKLSFDLYTKTKKWIPGHIYYSKKQTFYCLAKVKCRKEDLLRSKWLNSYTLVDGFILTETIPSGAKETKEVLENKCFGPAREDIRVVVKPCALIDGGEVLKDNTPENFMDLYKNFLDNAKNKYPNYDFSQPTYDLRCILDILSCQSVDHEPLRDNLDPVFISEVEESVKFSLMSTLLYRYEMKDLKLTNSVAVRTKELLGFWIPSIIDGNTYKHDYYEGLFDNWGGKSLTKMAKEVIENTDLDAILGDFNSYLIFGKMYFRGHPDMEPCVNQSNCKNYSYITSRQDKKSVADILGAGALSEAVVDIANNIVLNYGIGAASYDVFNTGTKSRPEIEINLRITLENIISYYGGEDKMPENLKDDILGKKFLSVTICCDKGKVIQ